MERLAIAELALEQGHIGLCPMPGRGGEYAGDLAQVLAWGPELVLSMATRDELEAKRATRLGHDLAAHGIKWRHLPVWDFGADSPALREGWPRASAEAHRILHHGGKVLVHCMGGCGRSCMAVLRLMIEAGEVSDHALVRLRDVRPCAVETDDQRKWASAPMWAGLRG